MAEQNDIDLKINLEGAEKAKKDASDLQKTLLQIKNMLESSKEGRGILSRFAGQGTQFKQSLDMTIRGLQNTQNAFTKITTEARKAGNVGKESLDKVSKSAQNNFGFMRTVLMNWKDLKESLHKRIEIYVSYKGINLFAQSVASAISAIGGLQTGFAQLQAISAASDGTMSQLADTIFATGNASRFAVEQLSDASVILAQAGYSAQQIEKLLPAVEQLSSATGTDLKTSVMTATSVLSVFNLEAGNAEAVVNAMAQAVNRTKADIPTLANGLQYAGATMSQMGVSWQETLAIMSAVTNAGMKARTVVGTGLRALASELTRPTDRLKKQLRELGLTLDDVDIKALGMTRVIKNLKEAGFGASEAYKGLEQRAATFYLAISSQLDTVDSLRQSFVDTVAAQKADEKQKATLSAQWTRFGNLMKNLNYNAFLPILDALTKLLTAFNNVIDALIKGDKAIGGFGSQAIAVYGTLKIIGLLLTKIKSLNVILAASKLADVFKGLKSATGGFATSLAGLKTALLSINGVLLGISLAIAAIYAAYNYFKNNSVEAKLEKVNGKLEENKTKIDSLNKVYDELIQKRELYANDEEALRSRIVEINAQFADQNKLLLTGRENYAELTKAVRDYRLEVAKEAEADRSKKRSLLQESSSEAIPFTAGSKDFAAIARIFSQVQYSKPSTQRAVNFGLKYAQQEGRGGVLQTAIETMTPAEASQLQNAVMNSKELDDVMKQVLNTIIANAMDSLLTVSEQAAIKMDADLKESGDELFRHIDTYIYDSTHGILAEFNQKFEDFKLKGMKPSEFDTLVQDAQNTRDGIYQEVADIKHFVDVTKRAFPDYVKTQDYKFRTDMINQLESEAVKIQNNISEAADGMKNVFSAWESITRNFVKRIDSYTRDDAIASADKYLENMRNASTARIAAFKTETYDKYGQTELANELIKAESDKIQQSIESFEQTIREKIEAMRYREGGMNGAFKLGLNKFVDDAQKSGDAVRNLNQAIGKVSYTLASSFSNNFSNAFQSIIEGTETVKESFRTMAIAILKELNALIIKMLVVKAVEMAIGWYTGGSSGIFTGGSGVTASGAADPQFIPFKPQAQGGVVRGPVKNRDSVPTMLMPGEFVVKKSAVDVLGTDYLNSLNNNAMQTIAGAQGYVSGDEDVDAQTQGTTENVTNIWLIDDRSQAQMGPNDVIAVIGKDISTGGRTRQLIKSVVAGRY